MTPNQKNQEMIKSILKKMASPFTNWNFYLIGLCGAALTIFFLTRFTPANLTTLYGVLAGSFLYAYMRTLFFPNLFKLNKNSKTNEDTDF